MPSLALGLQGQPRGGTGAAGVAARPGGCGAPDGGKLWAEGVPGGVLGRTVRTTAAEGRPMPWGREPQNAAILAP